MDYQINEEVLYKGKKAIIKEVYGNGYLQIQIDGELKDVYYNEIKGQEPIKIEFLGRISYYQRGTLPDSLKEYIVND